MSGAATNRILAEAIEHYGAGRRDQANLLCDRILESHPDHVQALNLAAVVAFISDQAAEGAALLHRIFSLEPNNARAFVTLGDALAVKGEHEGAADAFHRAVALRPRDADIHVKLGVALCELDRFEEAEATCRRAIELDPDLFSARFNLALVLTRQNKLADAADSYRAIIARDPKSLEAVLNLGNVLVDQGELREAIETYRHAITLKPDFAASYRNLALAFIEDKSLDEALAACIQAVSLDLGEASGHLVMGRLLMDMERNDEAIAVYRQAVALNPENSGLYCDLGVALHCKAELEEIAQRQNRSLTPTLKKSDWLNAALLAYRKAAELSPLDATILTNLAACHCDLKQFEEAIAACEQAIAAKPAHAPAITNLGIIFEAQDDIDAAVAAHRRAIAADPSYAKGYTNLAAALRSTGQIDEALVHSQRAVELNPDEPLVHYNHAHYLMMNGDFVEGLREFEWRTKIRTLRDGEEFVAKLQWEGDALAGRTLLVHAEFGLGDALQFVRYIPALAAMGGKVILQVQPALTSLLQNALDIPVFSRDEPLPPFDVHLPMMSLARVLGTTVETIPADIPYIFADQAKVARWRQALGKSPSLKVGVTWAGNPNHKGDRQRSIPAEAVLPHLLVPGVQLYSLQKEPRPADIPVLTELGDKVVHLAPALGDFSDTAAAIAALDLVIAVDSSVAHLAGAMGRPVWLMLPYSLDWRWLRDREDSPWYPTMRLFRQSKPRDWQSVFDRLPGELSRIAAGEQDLLLPAAKA